MDLSLYENRHPATSYHRVDGLWFDDGSIIIRSGNKEFRLYRGPLAAKSPVFSDMASFPSPEDFDAIDGIPVVCLPDSPDEVEAFLRALFDGEYLEPYPAVLRMSLPQLFGIARLSHKYNVRYLRRRAMSHLNHNFPSSLDKRSLANTVGDKKFSVYDEDLLLSAIPLFREIEALWLLPVSLHSAINIDVQDILSSKFSATDKENVFLGRSHHLVRLLNLLACLWTVPNPECLSPSTCGLAWTQYHKRYEDFIGKLATSIHLRADTPLTCNILDFLNSRIVSRTFCMSCDTYRQSRLTSSIESFWDDLPLFFRLGNWKDLLELKNKYDEDF